MELCRMGRILRRDPCDGKVCVGCFRRTASETGPAYLCRRILVGWVFFFSPSLGYALRYLWAMIGGGSGIADAQGAFLLFTHWLLFVIAAVGSTAYGRKLLNNAVRFSANRTVRMTVGAVLYIGIFFLSVAFLVTDTFNPFLYFRF